MIPPSMCRMLRVISENPGLSARKLSPLYGCQPTSPCVSMIPALGRLGLVTSPYCGTRRGGSWTITDRGREVLDLIDRMEAILKEGEASTPQEGYAVKVEDRDSASIVETVRRSCRPGVPFTTNDVRVYCKWDGHPIDHITGSQLCWVLRTCAVFNNGRWTVMS